MTISITSAMMLYRDDWLRLGPDGVKSVLPQGFKGGRGGVGNIGWLAKLWSHCWIPIIIRLLIFRVPKKGP